MKKYNLSKIMKRAWELVKKAGMTISSGLRKAWEEEKKAVKNALDEMYNNLNSMIANENSGIFSKNRQEVSVNIWEKYGKKRAYLNINEYKINGVCKKSYKCGYVDMIEDKYFCTKFDNINAEAMTVNPKVRVM